MADANGSAWARGVAVRSRALIAPEPEAETHYRRSDRAAGRGRVEVELARAHLLYGEWLRRRKRRRDAREHLRIAMEIARAGRAGPFAQRARTELEATGEHVTSKPARDVDLTSQEATVARLAAQGRTNARDRRDACSSASTPSTTTSARSSRSSGSPRVGSSPTVSTPPDSGPDYELRVVRRPRLRRTLGRRDPPTGGTDAIHHHRRRRPDLLQGLGHHRHAGHPQPRLAAERRRLGGSRPLPGRARPPRDRPRPPRPRPVLPDLARQRDGHLRRRPGDADRDPRSARRHPRRPLHRRR